MAYALEPWLRRCWKDRNQRAESMARHAGEFFNTQPYMASYVAGVVCALEEDLARRPISARAAGAARIKALKATLAGTLAGIGDALFWGTIRPFAAAAAAGVGLGLWSMGFMVFPAAMVATYLFLHNAPSLWIRWRAIEQGYRWKDRIAIEMRKIPWQGWILWTRRAGLALSIVLTVCAMYLFRGEVDPGLGFGALAAYGLTLAFWPKAGWKSLYAATVTVATLIAAVTG